MSNVEWLLLVLYLSECYFAFFTGETEEGEEADECSDELD